MKTNNLSRSAWLMALIVVCAIGGWELHLRQSHFLLSYDDNAGVWAAQRARVYDPTTTVFIGSSRIKYDLDLPTWKQLTGRKVVQLAIEGTSPIPILYDLADDPNFKGKLVVDVTETLFFNDAPPYAAEPTTDVHFFHNETPAQKASDAINYVLESQFVFLDKNSLALDAQLNRIPVKDRDGIFTKPPFPEGFMKYDIERQTRMTPAFVADTNQWKQIQNIWSSFFAFAGKMPPPSPNMIPNIMKGVTAAVNKIRARGGDVVFIRTPCSGLFWQIESTVFPKDKIWAGLLATTHCTGIHFTDYASTKDLVCPEWSHLTPQDAAVYTKALIPLLPPSFTKS